MFHKAIYSICNANSFCIVLDALYGRVYFCLTHFNVLTGKPVYKIAYNSVTQSPTNVIAG